MTYKYFLVLETDYLTDIRYFNTLKDLNNFVDEIRDVDKCIDICGFSTEEITDLSIFKTVLRHHKRNYFKRKYKEFLR